MIREALFIAGKDLQHMLRGRETVLWLFIMPLLFFYFIGTITSGFGGGRGAQKEQIALQTAEAGDFLVHRLALRLSQNGYEVVRPASEAEFKARSRRLELPESFTASVMGGSQCTLRLYQGGSELERRFGSFRVSRAVYTLLADVVAVKAAGEGPSPEAFARLDALPRSLSVEARPAGKRKEIPRGFEQAIPGTLVMFTLLVLLTTGAITLVIERRQGLLQRLASTPISPNSVVFGKWMGRMGLGAVQIGFALLAGTLLFRMNWGSDLPMVLAVLFGWGSLCASLGLLLGNVARTEAQAAGIGVLTTNLLAGLGGCWWPIEITPPWMRALAKFLPTGWAMDALHRLISYQSGAAAALPHVLLLLAAALLVGLFAAYRLRYR